MLLHDNFRTVALTFIQNIYWMARLLRAICKRTPKVSIHELNIQRQ
jgi:hypothetical protein